MLVEAVLGRRSVGYSVNNSYFCSSNNPISLWHAEVGEGLAHLFLSISQLIFP